MRTWSRKHDGTRNSSLLFDDVKSSQHNPDVTADLSQSTHETTPVPLVELPERYSEDTSLSTNELCSELQPPNIGPPEGNFVRGRNRKNPASVLLWNSDVAESNLGDYPRSKTLADQTSGGWPTAHNGELTQSLRQWRQYWDRSSFRPTVMPSARDCSQADDDRSEIDLTEFPWASGDIDWDR